MNITDDQVIKKLYITYAPVSRGQTDLAIFLFNRGASTTICEPYDDSIILNSSIKITLEKINEIDNLAYTSTENINKNKNIDTSLLIFNRALSKNNINLLSSIIIDYRFLEKFYNYYQDFKVDLNSILPKNLIEEWIQDFYNKNNYNSNRKISLNTLKSIILKNTLKKINKNTDNYCLYNLIFYLLDYAKKFNLNINFSKLIHTKKRINLKINLLKAKEDNQFIDLDIITKI